MSVKRFDISGEHYEVFGDNNGEYCLYEDYAALEARCAALAAELQSVKAMNDCLSEELRGYESDGAFEGPKMHLLWWQCETPNHDAFLAEVRAQGVEMFGQWLRDSADIFDKNSRHDWADQNRVSADKAGDFAAHLRKGVQS